MAGRQESRWLPENWTVAAPGLPRPTELTLQPADRKTDAN